MKRFIILLLLLNISACSVEENNRKALADKQAGIEVFQAELLLEPDAEILEFDTYTLIKLQRYEKDIRSEGTITPNNTPETLRTTEFYFVKRDHYAYPTLVIHQQTERGKDSWWSWQSTVERELFNRWFQEEFWFSNYPQDTPANCTKPATTEKYCPGFHQDQLTKLTRQSAMPRKLRIYAKCRCNIDSN